MNTLTAQPFRARPDAYDRPASGRGPPRMIASFRQPPGAADRA